MKRQHPFLVGIAALVLSAVLLIFTLVTQVSYAGGDPTGRMADGNSETNTDGGSVDHQGTKVGAGVEV